MTLMTITAVGCIDQWKVDEEYRRGKRELGMYVLCGVQVITSIT